MASDKQRKKVVSVISAGTATNAAQALIKRKKRMNKKLEEITKKKK